MTTPPVPFRQVHLDFHTSVACGEVGGAFDRDAFRDTAARARVAAMNVFARCHHGYSYYPTEVGTTHPGLGFDLLGAQIDALHAAEARAPIYVTLMWDDLAAERHPGWVVAGRDGRLLMRPPLSGDSQSAGGYSWSTLDLASAYGDYVCAQVEELCTRYDPDGFWFDIAFAAPNYSPWGQAQARDAGVDLANAGAMADFAYARTITFMERLTALVRDRSPNASVVYNHATDAAMRDKVSLGSHLEIESLPTASFQWGYLHYPLVARHARTQGVPFVGMTGRFHKSWADFGGLKNDAQLTYEVGTILAAGGRVSIGDQLPPSGALDQATYRLIGRAFERIEALEPWLHDTRPVTDLAILQVPSRVDRGHGVWIAERGEGVAGASQLCLETGIQFDIVDVVPGSLDGYPAVIWADGTTLDAQQRAVVDEYLAAGGRLITDSTSLVTDGTHGSIPWLPVETGAEPATVPAFVRPGHFGASAVLDADYDYVAYDGASIVRPCAGSIPWGSVRNALFERTFEHFTSHAQAPVKDIELGPLSVHDDRVLFIAAPLFRGLAAHDYWVYREILRGRIDEFLGARQIEVEGPAWLEVGVLQQDEPVRRRIVHLTAYQARRTTSRGPHVDSSWPIDDVVIRLPELPDAPTHRVYVAPGELPLPYAVDGGTLRIELPRLDIHTVVVIEARPV